MHARAIDDARTRLRDLRQEELQDLGLAGSAIGLALLATQAAPTLALPLFVGGMLVGVRGIVALWRHWDLVDRLAAEPDAYTIAEVLAYAARETTMERRRTLARLVRHHVVPSSVVLEARVAEATAELTALADELEDESLELSPACAVACSRLLTDLAQSPLLDPDAPVMALRSTVSRIRTGFTSRRTDDG
jgi:hypothetical protein